MHIKINALLLTIAFGMLSQALRSQNELRSENYGLTMGVGTTFGNMGVLGNSGLVFSLTQQTAVWQNLSLKTQFNYSQNNFNFKTSGSIPEAYRKAVEASIKDDNWHSYMITFGPSYSFGFKHAALNFNTGLGLMTINAPIQNINLAEGENYGYAAFGGNNGGALYQFGIDFQYLVSDKVRLFLETSYHSTFSDVVQWKEKDVSKAFVNEKLDERIFQLLNFESKSQKYNNLMLKIGIGIGFNTCNKTSKKGYDYYKASTDMKSSASGTDLPEKNNMKADDNNPESPQIKANINTSRTNVKQQDQGSTSDSVALKANHNTARSNKSTIKGDDVNSLDSVPIKANINTSRSNIKQQKQTNDTDSVALKTNHNSTRSNRSTIKGDDVNSSDSAQIKANINTSRSNIKQQKQTNDTDSVILKTNHNSTRSNRSTIKGDDVNSPDSAQIKANINTSRSNIKQQKQTNDTDSVVLKANHNTARSNKSTIKGDDVNSPDSAQIKANINTSRSNIKK